MTIRNLFGEKDPLPDPTDGDRSLGMQPKQDIVDRVASAVRDVQVARAVGDALRGSMPAAEAPVAEKAQRSTDVDVTGIVKSLTDMTTNAYAQLNTLQAKNPSDPFVGFLMDYVKRLEDRIESSRSGQGDPVSNIITQVETFQRLIDMMKDRFAPPPAPPAPPQVDGSHQVEMKKLDIQLLQMQQNFNLQMEAMKHQWDTENRQRDTELQLRIEELKLNKQRGEALTSKLSNIVGAAISAFDGGGGAARKAAASPPGAPAAAPAPAASVPAGGPASSGAKVWPKTFTCANCGGIVETPDGYAGQPIYCPGCNAQHNWNEVG